MSHLGVAVHSPKHGGHHCNFTFKLNHVLISGYLSFYLTYYVASLLSGFITAIFLIDT